MQTALRATTVKLDLGIRERIQSLADLRKRSPHGLMVEAIQQYIDREEKREAFRQEALLAYEEYQRTGLHITGDEAEAWLMQLESGQAVEPPVCHV